MGRLLFVLVLCAASLGCGTAPEVHDARVARTDFVLGTVESALLSVGRALTPHYEAAEAECAQLPLDLPYQRCIGKWDAVVDSLSTAYYTTSAARSGLAAGNDAPLVPCIASMVRDAIGAVQNVGITLPPAVASGLESARALAALLEVDGACEVQP